MKVAEVAAAHPDAEVQVWAEDEARFGLVPTYRRQWSLKGTRPIASSFRKYEWTYLSAFVHPAKGTVIWWRSTTVSTTAMSELLKQFAVQAGVGPKRQVILVVDRAGWHRAKRLCLPDGLHLCFLPAYSPELQPVERLWPLVREATANRLWRRLVDLIKQLDERCRKLDEQADLIRSYVQYAWWPKDRLPHQLTS